jgi:hypothetical protein
MENDYRSNLNRLIEIAKKGNDITDNDEKWIHENIGSKDMISEEESILLNAAQKHIFNNRAKRNEGNSASSPISST